MFVEYSEKMGGYNFKGKLRHKSFMIYYGIVIVILKTNILCQNQNLSWSIRLLKYVLVILFENFKTAKVVEIRVHYKIIDCIIKSSKWNSYKMFTTVNMRKRRCTKDLKKSLRSVRIVFIVMTTAFAVIVMWLKDATMSRWTSTSTNSMHVHVS